MVELQAVSNCDGIDLMQMTHAIYTYTRSKPFKVKSIQVDLKAKVFHQRSYKSMGINS